MTVKDFKGNVFFIKNLNVLGEMSLDKVILIDDNPVSYLYNQQNAIPIKPF
jgi:TFIIF-interacting CTD phosphatase-like protein